MVLRIVVGLVLTAAAFAIAGRRVWWLKRLAFSGQPAPERLEYAKTHPGNEAETQLTEVIDKNTYKGNISVRLGPWVFNCPFWLTTITVSGLVAMWVFTPSCTRGVPLSSTSPVAVM